jgi:hypothetical protein
LSRMQRRKSATCLSARQASEQATHVCAHSTHAAMHSASPVVAFSRLGLVMIMRSMLCIDTSLGVHPLHLELVKEAENMPVLWPFESQSPR